MRAETSYNTSPVLPRKLDISQKSISTSLMIGADILTSEESRIWMMQGESSGATYTLQLGQVLSMDERVYSSQRVRNGELSLSQDRHQNEGDNDNTVVTPPPSIDKLSGFSHLHSSFSFVSLNSPALVFTLIWKQMKNVEHPSSVRNWSKWGRKAVLPLDYLNVWLIVHVA